MEASLDHMDKTVQRESVEVTRTVWCCCYTDSHLLCKRELICRGDRAVWCCCCTDSHLLCQRELICRGDRAVWCCCCTDSHLLCQRELICKNSTSDFCFSRSGFAGTREHEQNWIVLFGLKVTLQGHGSFCEEVR